MRISYVQARDSFRKANSNRTYEDGAVDRYRTHLTEIIDSISQYVENSMEIPAKSGKGCRVTKQHIDLCCLKLKLALKEMEE